MNSNIDYFVIRVLERNDDTCPDINCFIVFLTVKKEIAQRIAPVYHRFVDFLHKVTNQNFGLCFIY